MPHDLPAWSTVYYYFRKWRIDGVWQKLNQALRFFAKDRAAGCLLDAISCLSKRGRFGSIVTPAKTLPQRRPPVKLKDFALRSDNLGIRVGGVVVGQSSPQGAFKSPYPCCQNALQANLLRDHPSAPVTLQSA